ncbi:MAG: biotin--[acetyl-CoA-carboxylase] ligase [Bryobacteraceae bacterium]
MNIASVRRRLPGRDIEYFATLDSTMRAAEGCPEGSVVVAGAQTAGMGRHGRTWHSELGSGLYCSIVLAPGPPALTLALGLATAEAIARVADLACDLRWPNDVLLGGRKVAGILVQGAVAGIGINVNHTAFPPELAEEATSLRLVTGREHSREDLLVELIPCVDAFCRMLREGGVETILELFTRRSSYACGKRVVVEGFEGVTAGLDPSGFLRVRGAGGEERIIVSGGVRALSS